MTVPYFTKVLGRTVSPAEAWAKASPAQRQYWWPDGAPPSPSGPAWSDGPTVAELEQAKAAGRRAIAAGFGARPTRADGLVACGHCTKCNGGRPDLCRQPQGKAAARLQWQQAAADRIDAADAASVAIQRVIWSEENRRGLAF